MADHKTELDQNCKKAVDHFKKDLTKLRSGRATPALLEGIMVDYYGALVPLIQMGLINAPEPRLLTVQVYDGSAVEAVEKAIMQANLGFNPLKEGSLLRINIPPLNEERRKQLIKKLHEMAEDAKVAIRGVRRGAMDSVKEQEKKKTISEDQSRKDQEALQKIIDRSIGEIDTLCAVKEKEMMEI
jgi:ribosome recycling factor